MTGRPPALKSASRKLWGVGLLVLAMGLLPVASAYYPLPWWLVVLGEPLLAALAMWLFNKALDQHIAYFQAQGAKRYRNRA